MWLAKVFLNFEGVPGAICGGGAVIGNVVSVINCTFANNKNFANDTGAYHAGIEIENENDRG